MSKKARTIVLAAAGIAFTLLFSACAIPQEPPAPIDQAAVTPDYGLIMQAAQDYYQAQNTAGNFLSYGDAVKHQFEVYFRDTYNADYSNYVSVEVDSQAARQAGSNSAQTASAPKGVSRTLDDPRYSGYLGMENDDMVFVDYDFGKIMIRPLYNGNPVLTYVQYYAFAHTRYNWLYDTSGNWQSYTCDQIHTGFFVNGQTELNDPYFCVHFTPDMLPAGMPYALKCWYAGSIINVYHQDDVRTNSSQAMGYCWVTMPGNIANSDIPGISSAGFYIYWGTFSTYYWEDVWHD